MNIYEITKRDLCNRNFAFKDEADLLGRDYLGRPFIFEGLLVNVCIAGTARVRIGYREYRVSANDMFVILPRQICSVRECSEELEVRIIMISLDFMCSLPIVPDFDLYRSVDVNPCVRLDEGRMDDILKIHSVIMRYGGGDDMSRQIQDTLICSIFLLAMSSFGTTGANPDRTWSRKEELTRNFLGLVVGSGGAERRVSYYADKLCVTPKYLTAVVKSVTSRPAQEWINEVVLVEARQLIMTSGMTVHQISDRLRFQTASSFVRFFRIHMGCTPLDYRRQNGGGVASV